MQAFSHKVHFVRLLDFQYLSLVCKLICLDLAQQLASYLSEITKNNERAVSCVLVVRGSSMGRFGRYAEYVSLLSVAWCGVARA